MDDPEREQLVDTWRKVEREARSLGFISGVVAVILAVVAWFGIFEANRLRLDGEPIDASVTALVSVGCAVIAWRLFRKAFPTV